MTGLPHIGHDFISRLTEIVESNLHNDQFGVDELAREMGMSRSSIHRRLKNQTNQSISQFIRKVRLENALRMLLNSDESAAEIAYKVGFSSPAYFNHCFHEHYGITPGDVRKHGMYNLDPDTGTGGWVPGMQNHIPSTGSKPARGNRKRKAIVITILVILALTLIAVMVNQVFYPSAKIGGESASAQKSIIVLPFRNFTKDPANQYFADGIAEDILNNLYHILAFRVVSRTSAEQFRDSDLPVGEIARRMKVGYVLEGSVRRYENKTRISVQLIDARNDDHLWSGIFDRELTDLINIQDEVALQVARALDAVLSESEISKIERKATQNPEAYDNYLRARFLLHKANSVQRAGFERAGVLNCIQYYEMAIAADSSFADAYAGLANAWFNLSAWGFLPAYEGFPKALDLSIRALELDPDCAEAHAVLGAHFIWGGQRKIAEGGKELKKAVELNPNFSTAHQWYAQYLMIAGPIEEARMHVNCALELEPYFWVVQTLSGWISYFEEKYDISEKECLKAKDLNPEYISNRWLLVLNYAKLGEGEKMVQELQAIIGKYSEDEEYPAQLRLAYEKGGIKGVFSWLIQINSTRPVPVEGIDGHPFYNAWWHVIIGNLDEAMYWLEQTVEDPRPLGHYSNLITTNPDFDILRTNPRFLKVIEKKGLTAFHTRRVKQ